MDEYINREALRDSVESIDWYSVRRGELATGAESSENALYKANDIYSAIDNAPSADVAPVRHGQWEPGNPICPVCGGNKFKDLDADIWADWEPPYCPNCGAKMDGGAD